MSSTIDTKRTRRRDYQRQWRIESWRKNPEKKRLHNLRNLKWSREHREEARLAVKRWAALHPDYKTKWKAAHPNYSKEYYQKSKDHRRLRNRAYSKLRRHSDLNFKLRKALSSRLHRAVRSRGANTLQLLGCSLPDFRIYIESKFEPGMTWENYGKVWHIDHIMPCAIFDLTKPEHQKRCFHFSNLQPLFAEDNIQKRARVLSNQFNLL